MEKKKKNVIIYCVFSFRDMHGRVLEVLVVPCVLEHHNLKASGFEARHRSPRARVVYTRVVTMWVE